MSVHHVDPTVLESSMDTDERALFRRVVQVLTHHRDLNYEVTSLNRKLSQHSSDKADLQKKWDAGLSAREKLTALYAALEGRNRELRSQALAQDEQEKVRREQLSAELNVSITAITKRMESDAATRNAILTHNDRLKLQLKHHEESVGSFMQKFEKTMVERDKESQLLQYKLQILMDREKTNAEVTPPLEAAMAEAGKVDDALRTEVAMYAKEFDALQKDLQDSNQDFHKNRSEIDRVSKRYKILESERSEGLRKLEKAQQSLRQAQSEKQELEDKIGKLEEQGKKLASLCDMMKAEIAVLKN